MLATDKSQSLAQLRPIDDDLTITLSGYRAKPPPTATKCTDRQNKFKENFMISVGEKQTATHHFIHDKAHAPPIHSSAIVIVFQNLFPVTKLI